MNRDALSLVKEYARIQKSIQPKVDRMEEIKDSLSKLLPQGKSFSNVGDVTLSENVTYPFSKSALSEGQKNRVMKKVYDSKKWASLYPDDYAAAKTLSESKPWKVTISLH